MSKSRACASPHTRTGELCQHPVHPRRCPNRADHERIAREQSAATSALQLTASPTPGGAFALVSAVQANDLADLEGPARKRALAEIAERDYDLPDNIADNLGIALDENGLEHLDASFRLTPASPRRRAQAEAWLEGSFRVSQAPDTDLTHPGDGDVRLGPDGHHVTWDAPAHDAREERSRAEYEHAVAQWHTSWTTRLTESVLVTYDDARDPDRLAALAARKQMAFTSDGQFLNL